MRYYNLSGGYGTHEIQQLFDIYGVTFTPHTFFNGITNIMGGGVLISTGGPYMEIVEDKYFEVSPIKLHINYFDPVTGETSVTATMIAPDVEIIDATIRFAMIEDNLDGTYQHVTRDIMKFDFDLSGQGNTFTTIENFEMADNYITSNLNAVVYVQTPELDIIQSVSSYDIPDYKVRALVPFEMDHFDPDYDPEGAYTYEGEFFSIINYGLEDDLTIDLVIDDAPDGWTMSFCDDVNCYLSTADFSLPQVGYDQFHVNVMPTSFGSAEYHFEITSDNA
ncbi:MAG: hypothetical protein H8E57_10930, partial [Candidatus Cloacimonetes bacterium]|nr:hypothetical protein [Candidatus Cloacimonadota bacterium]